MNVRSVRLALLCGLVASVTVVAQAATPVSTTQAKVKTTKVLSHDGCRYYRHQDAKTHKVFYSRNCNTPTTEQKVVDLMDKIAPGKDSALNQRVLQQQLVSHFKYAISFYEPTYILPGYYSSRVSPYYAENPGNTPDDIEVNHTDFKGQMSFVFPMIDRFFIQHLSFNAAYTQLIYWQLYSKSPYFRETNYEPRLFFSYHFHHNWLFNLGMDHQSNGRGGVGLSGMERSWNRLYADIEFSGEQWLVIMEPWLPVLKKYSSDLHNPDIDKYMGYGRIILAYQFNDGQELSLTSRNVFSSGFRRGALELNYAFPVHRNVRGFLQVFSGYGQSLIEYNHYTNAVGLGIALSDWI